MSPLTAREPGGAPECPDLAPSLTCNLARLFKLRVVGLLVLAAVAGAFVGGAAGGGRPQLVALAALALSGGLAAAGASVINEYLEWEPDSRMERTRERPLVTGAIARRHWLPALGMAMIAGPALAALPHNPAFTLFLTLGALIYVGVYTIWLKPRSVMNVVVGGLAGSCAVLTGGAAVGAWSAPGVLALALLLFFWSPTHFWSLALACREDYARAKTPMLPVVAPARCAAAWGLAHAAASALAGVGMGAWWAPDRLLLIAAAGAGALLLVAATALVALPTPRRAWRMFHVSNVYLGIVLLAALVSSLR